MRVGKRLECVLDQIDDGLDCVVDMGADHGFLTLKILETKKPKLVIATDISEPSLNKTKQLIFKKGLENQVEFVVSDGFKNLNNFSIDCVVIAGLGGREIIKILTEKPASLKVKSLVLQPMQDTILLRQFLYQSGFVITYDKLIQDRNKYYSVIVAKTSKKSQILPERNLFVGITDWLNPGKDCIEFLRKEIIRINNKKFKSEQDTKKLKYYNDLLKKEI